MTPLAHQLARQLTLPVKDRDPVWGANAALLRESLDDAHFFEVTAVIPLIDILPKLGSEAFGELCFLPAPKVWLEALYPYGRIGLLIEHVKDDTARVTAFWPEIVAELGTLSTVSDDYFVTGGATYVPQAWMDSLGPLISQLPSILIASCHMFLAIINSPKVIARKQHAPHSGLQKQLARAFGGVGKFPLRAWTELELVAFSTIKEPNGAEFETRLSGSKCLHFCRKHIRVRNGKLELVSAHWRGDPALGIKRTRYNVVAKAR